MFIATWLAAGAICFGDLWLIGICIRRRVVLGGVAGVAGLALLGLGVSRGVSGDTAHAELAIALVFLILGTALVGLGGLLEHLLDDPLDSQDT